jgi:hypothetical protein
LFLCQQHFFLYFWWLWVEWSYRKQALYCVAWQSAECFYVIIIVYVDVFVCLPKSFPQKEWRQEQRRISCPWLLWQPWKSWIKNRFESIWKDQQQFTRILPSIIWEI